MNYKASTISLHYLAQDKLGWCRHSIAPPHTRGRHTLLPTVMDTFTRHVCPSCIVVYTLKGIHIAPTLHVSSYHLSKLYVVKSSCEKIIS